MNFLPTAISTNDQFLFCQTLFELEWTFREFGKRCSSGNGDRSNTSMCLSLCLCTNDIIELNHNFCAQSSNGLSSFLMFFLPYMDSHNAKIHRLCGSLVCFFLVLFCSYLCLACLLTRFLLIWVISFIFRTMFSFRFFFVWNFYGFFACNLQMNLVHACINNSVSICNVHRNFMKNYLKMNSKIQQKINKIKTNKWIN